MVGGTPIKWGKCSHTVPLNNTPWCLVCWKDIVAVSFLSNEIIIFDMITGTQKAVLSGHTNSVRSVVLSSDGTLLVSGSDDKTVKLWDVQTGGVVNTFQGHIYYIYSVSLSVDCTLIASGSGDKTIRLWNIQTRECCQIIEQQGEVDRVILSPTNPQHLMSISGGKVWQWDVNGHQINPPYGSSCVAFSSDGTQFVSYEEETVIVQKTGSQMIVAKFPITNGPRHYCFSPNGRLIAFANYNIIYIWDISSPDPYIIETCIGHIGTITSITFSSPSSLISSSYEGSVKFWQISTSLTDPAVTDPKFTTLASAPIKFITLQAKDSIAFSCDIDGIARVWDISTGHCKGSFQTPVKDYRGRDIQLIDGRMIFVCHADKLYIWDMEKGEPIQIVDTPDYYAEDVKISGDGSKVFCLHYRSIQAWSIVTGEGVGKVELEHLGPGKSLTVDGLRVWVHSPMSELQGWDFGIQNPSPIQLSSMPPPNFNSPKLWDVDLPRIKDTVSGKVVFQLGGRFAKPVSSQWDGGYLVAGYHSGEVLILDFNHMLSNRNL